MIYASVSFGQTTGGPDAFGYYWWNESDQNGPTYTWIDISQFPTADSITGLADDNAHATMVSMGFDFRFYWSDYNAVKLGSNGWISFDNVGNIASCYPSIPTPGGAGDNLVCPMMSDLNFTTAYPTQFPNPAEMWTWTNNSDTFIVQYNNVPWWDNDNGGASPPDWKGDNTFQVIFTSTDSSITFQYNSTTPNDLYDAQSCPVDATIGIENLTGNIGLEYAQNTIPGAGRAIKFRAPSVLISIEDATPAWNANSDNQGQFFMTGSNVTMTTNIKNVGNATMTGSIGVDAELESLSLSQIWTDNSSVSSGLAAGVDTTINFSSPALLSTPGQYYYNVSTSSAGDINPSNNDNTTEVSAIMCANDTINMTYATMNAPDGSISWSSGDEDEGVGVYYVPPFHPVDIEAIDVWVGSDGDSLTPMPAHGMTIRIFDGDVSTGPQNLLQTEFLGSSAAEATWNRITLDTAITITSGGFFVGWFQNGDSLAIGTEAFGPISQRSYEILAGAWSPYRANTSEEMLINVHATMNCALSTEPTQPEPKKSNVVLFPNPTNNLLNVQFLQEYSGDVNFVVRDIYGKEVYSRTYPTVAAGGYKFSIATDQFEAGLYFLTMENGNEEVTQKFVVKH